MFSRPSFTQLDILRETANVGAGHAATALSELLGTTVHMRVPNVRVVPFHLLAESVGGTETEVMAVYFRLQGDFGGSMYVLMEGKTAGQLLGDLFGQQLKRGRDLTAMDCSALCEVGNIVAGSYLSALSDFTGLKLLLSVPHLAFDMAGAVLSVGVIEIAVSTDEALMIDTQISTGNVSTDTHVILLPQPDNLPVLFRALGVNGHGH